MTENKLGEGIKLGTPALKARKLTTKQNTKSSKLSFQNDILQKTNWVGRDWRDNDIKNVDTKLVNLQVL